MKNRCSYLTKRGLSKRGIMRQRKYRVWNPKAKIMIEWDIVKNMMAELLLTESEVNVPLEFTGLLDKSGAEIYESDVFSYDGCSGYVEYKGCSFRVRWIKNPMGFNDSLSVHVRYGLKIVGNLYENPELLKNN